MWRDRREAATSQGMAGASPGQEDTRRIVPVTLESTTLPTPDYGLLASRTVGEKNSCCVNPPSLFRALLPRKWFAACLELHGAAGPPFWFLLLDVAFS